MFRRKVESVRELVTVKAPKPSNSDLPEIPADKTWYVDGYHAGIREYTGSRMHVTENWIRIVQVTENQWVYSARNNTWCHKESTELTHSINLSDVRAYGVVKP